ncbi:MAG: knotted carbamoyltransferase YgeW [Candidatus Eisenbacteria bacterium]|nr:knotted carbamoyltransferase YgeW [Candidatus Eisenbacteria bacterium]
MNSTSSLPNLDRNTLAGLLGKSLMLTSDWSRAEIDALLAVASRFEAADRAGKSTAFLPDQLAYALFFDNSTRTKSAWAGASSRLGMRPVIVDGSSTQVEHGETAEETGAMLGMNSHAMGIRHDLILGAGNTFMRSVKAGIDDYLKATNDARKVPVVNLQCDIDHPTQTLADLMWLREYFPGGLKGKKIAMSWAYSPSYAKPLSVPQGIAMLMAREGAQVTLAHPEGYRLMDSTLETARKHAAESGGKFEVVHDMDAAFKDADVVYPKSWGPYDLMLERVDANSKRDKAAMGEIERRALDRNASHKDWICDERRMALTTGGDALYMHCLPADIGDEVTPGVMAKHKVNVAREANKKMYVVMALLAVAKVENLGAKFGEVLR